MFAAAFHNPQFLNYLMGDNAAVMFYINYSWNI